MDRSPIEEQADVVVIGGGIAGASVAYFLAKRGSSVVLVEKGELSDEQSGRNWGWVRQQGRNPREIPLIMLAINTWAEIDRELDADLEWVQAGSLRLAYDDETMAKFEHWAGETRPIGLDTRILSATEAKELVPTLEGGYLGGAYTPGDGQAEPRKATTAIAVAAREFGAHVYTHCAAEGIDVTKGAVTGVVTERGFVKTSTVVCAAGAWSAKVGRMVGLSLPQRAVRATVARTAPLPRISDTVIWGDGVSIRQRGDGRVNIAGGGRGDYDVTLDALRSIPAFMPNYWRNRRNIKLRVGEALLQDIARSLPWSAARKHPFAHTVGVEPAPNMTTVENSRRNLMALLPSLGEVAIEDAWAGRIDATPDGTPVVGPVPGVDGFIFATGFSGHGFAMGPGAGKVLAELILDGKPSVDLHPLRYTRFKEGDKADWSMTI